MSEGGVLALWGSYEWKHPTIRYKSSSTILKNNSNAQNTGFFKVKSVGSADLMPGHCSQSNGAGAMKQKLELGSQFMEPIQND